MIFIEWIQVNQVKRDTFRILLKVSVKPGFCEPVLEKLGVRPDTSGHHLGDSIFAGTFRRALSKWLYFFSDISNSVTNFMDHKMSQAITYN